MVFFLVLQSFQALLLVYAVPELWSRWHGADCDDLGELVSDDAFPPVSVVATVAGGRGDALRLATMLLGLDYPRHEVVLVLDDSPDGTLAILTEAFALYPVPPAFAVHLRTAPVQVYYRSRMQPRLLVVNKAPGGRADAMNAGLNAARYPHVLTVGLNITLARDALRRLARPFVMVRSVVAVGAALRPAKGVHAVAAGGVAPGGDTRGATPGWLVRMQMVEYLRNFLYQRLGWNRLGSNLLFPGNATLFRRDHLLAIGGFRTDAAVPALDVAVRLHRHLTGVGVNPSMPVIPDPVAWMTVPDRLGELREARIVWHRGLVAALRSAGSATLNPEYGAFGVLVVPYGWVGLVIAPVVELLGYGVLVAALLTGAVGSPLAWAYLAAVVGYGMLLSVWTVVLDLAAGAGGTTPRRDVARLFLYAMLESAGYRQLIAWYRARALFPARRHTVPSPQPSPQPAHQ